MNKGVKKLLSFFGTMANRKPQPSPTGDDLVIFFPRRRLPVLLHLEDIGGGITKCKVVEPKSFAQSIAEMGFPVVIQYEPNSHECVEGHVPLAWRIIFDVSWSNSDGLSYADNVKDLLNEAWKLHGVPGVQLHEWSKAQWRGTSLPTAQEIRFIREATATAVRSILDGYTLHCAFVRTAKERGGM